jgi:acetolactate synthase-1/2/3 large subunit
VSGGELIADVLAAQGVRFLFTLCGGHISPILVAAKARGIRVVDVRDEATAVFAADAVARLTGVPGVAAVTAGPGVTNTITAVKNAQLAQSPLVLLGGATATLLKGRGALQDIDQLALVRPHVKRAVSVRRLRHLGPELERAFRVAQEGVPGPTFVECPVDLLYDESVVRGWYRSASPAGEASSSRDRVRRWYLDRHLERLFRGAGNHRPSPAVTPTVPSIVETDTRRAATYVARAERPVLMLGSQVMLPVDAVDELAQAVARLGMPVYLSGMARGLLGRNHPLQVRHRRREALREADLVILAGVPCDFRLGYGRGFHRRAVIVSANRSKKDLTLNRRPTLGVHGDPAAFIRRLSSAVASKSAVNTPWLERLRERDREREIEIERMSKQETSNVNPLALCRAIDHAMDDDSVLVLDGGDFVASSAYITTPRGPLSSLDPGPFGTLGAGAGFALGAKLARPSAEVWLLYGDGSAGFSLTEFDTFVRHEIPVIAVVGNDACWTQIAREQRKILNDDVGTSLRSTDYHRIVEGCGAAGLVVENPDDVDRVLASAKSIAKTGSPVLVNARIGETDFRSGSISI